MTVTTKAQVHQPIPLDEWKLMSLEELVGPGLFCDGDWVESKDQDPDGDVRLIQLADIGDGEYRDRSARFLTSQKAGELNCTFLEPNDVLVARMPDPLGRACLFPGDKKRSVTVVDVCIMRSVDNRFNPRWLMHAINAPGFRAEIEKLQSGTTRKRISRKNLATLVLPVPPRDQQDLLVAETESRLSRLDKAVADLRSAETKLKRHRAATLAAATSGRLVPTEAALAQQQGRDYEPASVLLQRILAERRRCWEADQLAAFAKKGTTPRDDRWKAKYQEPVAPDTTSLPDLPEGWVWASLDQLLTNIEAGKSFKCEEHRPDPGQVGVLKVSAVSWGEYDEDETKTCTESAKINPDYYVAPGDFLFSRANTIDLVGACVIAKRVTFPAMLCDKTLRFQFAVKSLKEWVLYCLRSQHGRSEIERLATGNQESMRNIGQGRIKAIRIPLPPAAEAQRILSAAIRCLEGNGQLQASQESNQRRSVVLRSAVLQQAFQPGLGAS